MTATDILLRWMETALAQSGKRTIIIRSSDIQTRVPSWGRRLYGKQYAPNNYIRRFREVRQNKKRLHQDAGIESIEKVNIVGARQAGWKITRSISAVARNHENLEETLTAR